MRWGVTLLVVISVVSASAFTLIRSDGNELAWPQKKLVFYYNSTDCPPSMVDDINRAMALWNSVSTSYLKLELGPYSSNTPAQGSTATNSDKPLITCDSAFGTTLPNVDPNGTAGVGSATQFDGEEITNGWLNLNTQDGAAANIAAMNTNRRRVVIAHEIGHVLGIGHSGAEEALMYFTVGTKTNLNLAQDDVDALTYLYPRDELGSDGLFGCGLVGKGTNSFHRPGGPQSLLLLLFPLLLLGLLRRRAAVVHP